MVTILHNPRCSTSRKVLGMIEERGLEPQIVDYTRHPLTRRDLISLLVALDASPRDVIRRKEDEYRDLGLDRDTLTDNDLIDALIAHPRLIERPIVITDKGAAICRPPEKLNDLL